MDNSLAFEANHNFSIEELRSNFLNLKYEYFENDLPRIPGINNKSYHK